MCLFLMQKIKFIESNLEYQVSLSLQNGRVVCSFNSKEDYTNAPLSEGFVEINEHNGIIQSNFEKYKYVYKEDSDNLTFILTDNEEDVWIDQGNESALDSDTILETYEQTEEEIAEREKQQEISSLRNQINTLKSKLAETDYIFIKCYEASLVGENIEEYDFTSLHEERQNIRNQVNTLEEELNELLSL